MSVGAARLREAAADFRFLLGRGYPAETSLTLVGNRHTLPALERDLLRRSVVAPRVAEARRARLVPLTDLAGKPLAVDGHNQLISLETALRGGPLVAADDGVVRDVARAAAGYRPSEATGEALSLLLAAIALAKPSTTLFLFDAPVPHSGELAALTRARLAEANLPGEARTAPYPEAEIEGYPGVVATADGGLIERCAQAIDLAGGVIRARFPQLVISLEAKREKEEA